MSYVRLTDLPRTTSFRLALLFLALFGAASLALFGFLYAQTRGHLQGQVQDWLRREQASFRTLDRESYLERLAARSAVDPTLERPFTLLAGTPLELPPALAVNLPLGRTFEFSATIDARSVRFLGLAQAAPFGGVLLIAQDLTESREFDELLLNSFVWGGLVTVALGLAGPILVGTDAVRRIEAVTRTTEQIIGGNLSKRLPTRGRIGDLDRLAGVINSMLAEIEYLMLEVKAAGDNIAHDLRTPLTRLLAGLERASRRGGSIETLTQAVDAAIEELRDILDTFSALLRIAEVESGARRAGFCAIDLTEIATDVVEFYLPMAEERSIALDLVQDGVPAASIPGDPSLLFEALGNLVDNALKYTAYGGRVTVRVLPEKRRPGFEVSDNGLGIPAAQREAVLRRFHRLDASRQSPGTGLGLALVAAVARLHAMELAIEDAAPGCRITLTWRRDDRRPTPVPSATAAD